MVRASLKSRGLFRTVLSISTVVSAPSTNAAGLQLGDPICLQRGVVRDHRAWIGVLRFVFRHVRDYHVECQAQLSQQLRVGVVKPRQGSIAVFWIWSCAI